MKLVQSFGGINIDAVFNSKTFSLRDWVKSINNCLKLL